MTQYENYRVARFAAGDFVIRCGEPGDDIFILRQGEAEIITYDRSGQAYVVATVRPGQSFGEMAFIMEEPRDIAVRALTDIEVEVVSSRIFAELFDLDIGKRIRPILQAFSERLRSSYASVSERPSREKRQAGKPPGSRNPIEVTMIPVNARSVEAMNGLKTLKIEKLPFYIGRHSLRRSDNLFHGNELHLFDQIPYSVSRSHCAIVAVMNELYFVDRGSTLGSIVNGVRIGGDPNAPKKITLHPGDNEVLIGDATRDAYLFTVVVKDT